MEGLTHAGQMLCPGSVPSLFNSWEHGCTESVKHVKENRMVGTPFSRYLVLDLHFKAKFTSL